MAVTGGCALVAGSRQRAPRALWTALCLGLLAIALAALLWRGWATPAGEAPVPLTGSASAQASASAPAAPLARSEERGVRDAYARLPLAFAANAGQSAGRVRYLAQGAGFGFYFLRDRVVLDFQRPAVAAGALGEPAALKPGEGPFAASERSARRVVLHLRFLGANPRARLEARARAPGQVSYLKGARPGASQSGIASYRELAYRELWPGTDLIFRGQGGKLKYEFRLRPGADPAAIRLAYAGAEGLSLGAAGALRVDTALGQLKDARPLSYQRRGGRRLAVESRYALKSGDRYGFALGAYDKGQPLVIDPGLVYSTYLGGSALDHGVGIAVDGLGQAYVTGGTVSADFPTEPSPGAYDETRGGSSDAFVTKMNAAGTALVYSTYLGGRGRAGEEGSGIAVDREGQAYVTGITESSTFPTEPSPGAYDETLDGSSDAFVTKLNAAGTALLYSTYLGGGSDEWGLGIAVDGEGQSYVTGRTGSGDFPTEPSPGAYDETFSGPGTNDAFVTKLNAAGTALVYSTFLGSGVGSGIAVDGEGQAYVTGVTTSSTFPTEPSPGAYDETLGGGSDAFVTKLNAAGTALVYSTYLGGGSDEWGFGIAVDVEGQAYVTGQTSSADFPTEPSPGAYDETLGGGSDAFVTKLNAAGTALVYSTYLGGSGGFAGEGGRGIAVDGAGQAYVTGGTFPPGDFPTEPSPGAYDETLGGGSDAFVTKLNAAGTALLYSTYLGGSGSDIGVGIAVDGARHAYVTGLTSSGDFPTEPSTGAYDETLGGTDAFVTKLDTGEAPPPPRVAQHFKAYDVVATTAAFPRETILLTDQFGEQLVRLERPRELLVAVEKQRQGHEPEPIQRPDQHLKCYRITGERLNRTVRVRNQFTESTLLVKEPTRLCAPAAKSVEGEPAEPPADLDHMKCYAVGREQPAFPSELVTLRDQFGEEQVRLGGARFLCNPVQKQREAREPEPIIRADEHLVCYRFTEQLTPFEPRDVLTRDQFGRQGLRVRQSRLLCVPSEKEAIAE